MSESVTKLRVADGAKSQTSEPSTQTPQKPQVGKPNKILPTVRISFSKQLDILRAYAAVSGSGAGRMVTLKDVADIVQMAPQTVSLANPFFSDVRLLIRSEGGTMAPGPEAMEYQHAYEWDKETAAHKLAPVFAKTWFWDALQPRLAFDKLTEDQAVTILAEKSTAGPTYKSQLKMILEFLEAAGLVKRENGQVSLLKGAQLAAAAPTPETKEQDDIEPAPPQRSSPGMRSSAAMTNFAQKAGSISFDISVRVDVTELIGWSPERIAALFSGIAQVVSAKGTFEKTTIEE